MHGQARPLYLVQLQHTYDINHGVYVISGLRVTVGEPVMHDSVHYYNGCYRR